MARRWGTGFTGLTEQIRRRRIKVSVAAWAYENGHKPIMTDAAYDKLSKVVYQERNIATGNNRLDRFFRQHFDPSTGLWVYKHPNPRALETIYARYYQKRRRKRR